MTGNLATKLTAMLFSLVLFGQNATAQLQIDWYSTFGLVAPRPGGGGDVAVDPQGNVFVTGESAVATSEHDITTIKYGPDGTQQWVRHYNGTGDFNDLGEKIGIDSGGNIYAGGISWGGGNFGTGPKYDIVVLKYDTLGNLLWTFRFNSVYDNDDYLADMKVLPDGTTYLVGWSYTPTGQPPDADYVILKINAAGGLEWSRFYDGPEDRIDWLAAVLDADAGGASVAASVEVLTPNGDMSIYGAIRYSPDGSIDWAGDWRPPMPPFGIPDFNIVFDGVLDPFGNFIVVGRADDGTSSDSPADAVVVKFDSTGQVAWSATNRTLRSDEFERVTTDTAGNVFAVGAFNIETNFTLHAEHLTAAYSANGDFLWEHRFGGDVPNFDGEGYAAVNSRGELVVATRNIMDETGEDIRMFIYDRMSGNILDQTSFDSGCCDWVKGMTLDSQDNIVLTGHSRPDGTNRELLVVKASPRTPGVPGDIDGDGDVDMVDRDLFVAVLLGANANAEYADRSDMNGDGTANGIDAGLFTLALTGQ